MTYQSMSSHTQTPCGLTGLSGALLSGASSNANVMGRIPRAHQGFWVAAVGGIDQFNSHRPQVPLAAEVEDRPGGVHVDSGVAVLVLLLVHLAEEAGHERVVHLEQAASCLEQILQASRRRCIRSEYQIGDMRHEGRAALVARGFVRGSLSASQPAQAGFQTETR